MAAGVLPLSYRICRDLRLLRIISISAATIAAVSFPFAFVYGGSYRWLFALAIGSYTARKIAQFLRNDRVLKQIRLEERFFRQQMDGPMLGRCVRRSEHLWDDSLTLRGLRAVLARPIPRLFSETERSRQVQEKYHAVFRKLRPAIVTADLLLPIGGIMWLAVRSLPLDPPVWLSLAIAALVALTVLEIGRIRAALLVRKRFESYERALSLWTLGHADIPTLFNTPRRSGYRHELLYRADPVYSVGARRPKLMAAHE